MKNSKILNSVKTSIMTVIIVLCAWISVPFPIPFTLQTLGIYLAVLLLGSKNAFVSVLLYILLGTAGLPVFSGFSSGAGYISGPTGGYLFGFLLCPLICIVGEILLPKKKLTLIFLAVGTLLCYTTGTLWFAITTNQTHSLWRIIYLYVLPYIIPDAIKLTLAHHISKKLKPILMKTNKE